MEKINVTGQRTYEFIRLDLLTDFDRGGSRSKIREFYKLDARVLCNIAANPLTDKELESYKSQRDALYLRGAKPNNLEDNDGNILAPAFFQIREERCGIRQQFIDYITEGVHHDPAPMQPALLHIAYDEAGNTEWLMACHFTHGKIQNPTNDHFAYLCSTFSNGVPNEIELCHYQSSIIKDSPNGGPAKQFFKEGKLVKAFANPDGQQMNWRRLKSDELTLLNQRETREVPALPPTLHRFRTFAPV